jgi:uncharacterized protein RhaS with RHS repeats
MRRILLAIIVTVCASNCFAYYQAQQGRWTSRDPIAEQGGINLYAMVQNKPINKVDYLGLETIPGITVRRFLLGGSHQWFAIEQPLPPNVPMAYKPPLAHIGVNKNPENGGGMWVNEEMNRSRAKLENSATYYEWNVVKIDKGKSSDGKPCKCVKISDIKSCIGTTIITECAKGTPDDFGIVRNNCRDNSERVLTSCCAKKGTLINNPNDSSSLGRWSRDWFVGPFRYAPRTRRSL